MSRIHYQNYRGITLLARDLRRDMTPSEILLWDVLRKKKLNGYKFLRQHPVFYRIDHNWVEFFVADFYCAKLRLIIELDGEVHLTQKDYDTERDQKLKSKGIKVSRLNNTETLDNKHLAEKIKQIIRFRESEVL